VTIRRSCILPVGRKMDKVVSSVLGGCSCRQRVHVIIDFMLGFTRDLNLMKRQLSFAELGRKALDCSLKKW
jgi:hypothetical protein